MNEPQWSSSVPTEDGWYWVHEMNHEPPLEPAIFWVCADAEEAETKEGLTFATLKQLGCHRFAGPLKAPANPADN